MEQQNDKKVLIAEDDSTIRQTLIQVCEGLATPHVVTDDAAVPEAMARESYDLLLIDWHLGPRGSARHFESAAQLQHNAWRVVLFTIPSVKTLVDAMQAGAHDAWWVARDQEPYNNVVGEWLRKTPVSKGFLPIHLSRLADAMSAKAAARNVSYVRARREFSRVLVKEITGRHQMKRNDLAQWMGVSVRTIQRLLASG